ncbi:hypothetical protein I302_100228 [Kwoniella bestiolae CBS 10118]|uniref:Uncharacterized protein n=1 Tax=Kwoniella bestiolae CBS 10118 TaxID=1296100 RepID=A0A1B9G4I2_9TREE|nr:hypothetical protein I302_03602 [Kwoniella bestiolae CBS 10118]OCF25926.1 hypothetical protein I302_03602 [Kwoniella bestiolae CBS 10118]
MAGDFQTELYTGKGYKVVDTKYLPAPPNGGENSSHISATGGETQDKRDIRELIKANFDETIWHSQMFRGAPEAKKNFMLSTFGTALDEKVKIGAED